MPLAELDIAPRRLAGRQPRALEVSYAGDLGPSDLALLASERGEQKPQQIKHLRERHHQLARCLARGMAPVDASAITGYHVSTISILRQDPTFKELMAHYEKLGEVAYADFADRATAVSIDALNIIADRLEESPEEVSTSMALEIAKQLADRTGHSPVAKAVNVNVNADLTARLTAARARVAKANAVADVLPGLPDPGT